MTFSWHYSNTVPRQAPRRSSRFVHTLKALVATVSIFGASSIAIASDFPDPSDEQALYQNARDAGGRIVYYSGQPAEQAAAIATAFQEQYPGLTLETIRLVGPILFDRFTKETSARQNIADVLYVADYSSMIELMRRDMIAEWKVPTYDRIPDNAKYGYQGYSVQFSQVVLAYNTDKVSEEEVELLKNWSAVADPRFKGRLAVAANACAICYAGLQLFLTSPEYGEEFLEKVAQNEPEIYPSTVVALDRVIAGERDVAFWSFESAIVPAYLRGAPVRWVQPKPTPVFGPIIGVANTAPNPNGARLFLNWLMSDEGAKVVLETGSLPTLEGVEDTRSYPKEDWYDPIKELYTVDFDRWDEKYFDDLELWKDILERNR